MPVVTIQITREGKSSEQKAALIQGATDPLADVLNKPPGLSFAVIREVEMEMEMEDSGVGACRCRDTGVRPGPDQRAARSNRAFSISSRRRATSSAAGSERASGAPWPAHWAP